MVSVCIGSKSFHFSLLSLHHVVGFCFCFALLWLTFVYMWEFQDKEEGKELELGPEEPEAPLPLSVTSRVSFRFCTI